MAELNIQVNKNKIKVILDRDKLENLVKDLGLYNEEFIRSVKRGMRDFKKGKVYKLKDLNV